MVGSSVREDYIFRVYMSRLQLDNGGHVVLDIL